MQKRTLRGPISESYIDAFHAIDEIDEIDADPNIELIVACDADTVV